MMTKSWGRFRVLALIPLVGWAGLAAGQTPTPTVTPSATSTPLVLPFNPDLDDNGLVNAIDLLFYIQAWQAIDFVEPTPTPVSYILTGIVSSSSPGLGIQGARVIAGTATQLTGAQGFYQLLLVNSDIDTLLVHKDGFQDAEIPIAIEFPVTLISPILFPLGAPTFTPTSTGTPTETPTTAASVTPTASSTPTRTPTATGSILPTPTRTRTPTRTPTSTRTPTPSRTQTPTRTLTPTTIPLLGVWEGKLNPEGGTIYNNTSVAWTVLSATRANALILSRNLTGPYDLSLSNGVVFNGTNEEGSALFLEMLWDGANHLSGDFDIFIPTIGQEQGPVVMDRTP
jgi:hypothetical protein